MFDIFIIDILLVPVCHEAVVSRHPGLDLLHGPGDDAHQLGPGLRDQDVVLYPDSSRASELVDPLGHQEPADLWISQGSVNQEVNEITTRFNGQTHADLKNSGSSE